MGPIVVLLVAIILVCNAVLIVVLRRPPVDGGSAGLSRYDAEERSRMPPDLAGARLVMSEHLLRTRSPVKLVAKTDQVFLIEERQELVPVETKTRLRDEVYPSDVIELSVQACVMRHGRPQGLKGARVATYGYVRVVVPGSVPRYHRVDLYGDDEVVAMRRRRLQVEAGAVEPAAAPRMGMCCKCAYRSKCARRLA